MKLAPRPTKKEREERNDQIERKILQGASYDEIAAEYQLTANWVGEMLRTRIAQRRHGNRGPLK